MQNYEVKNENQNLSQRYFMPTIFYKYILPSIKKKVDRGNRNDTINMNKIVEYDEKGDITLPFQTRFVKTLLMCVEYKIDTTEVWEALKDIFPFHIDIIDEVEARKKSITEIKKLL